MSIKSLTDWKNSFAEIPLVADQAWKSNWCDWILENVAGMKLAGYVPDSNITFTFNKSTFISSLTDSVPGTSYLPVLASAFEAAIIASTMVLTPPFTTPTLDTVASCTVDPASVAVGKAYILATDIVTVTSDAKNAKIIPEMRKAFAALTYTVTGKVGPNPVTLPAQGVL